MNISSEEHNPIAAHGMLIQASVKVDVVDYRRLGIALSDESREDVAELLLGLLTSLSAEAVANLAGSMLGMFDDHEVRTILEVIGELTGEMEALLASPTPRGEDA